MAGVDICSFKFLVVTEFFLMICILFEQISQEVRLPGKINSTVLLVFSEFRVLVYLSVFCVAPEMHRLKQAVPTTEGSVRNVGLGSNFGHIFKNLTAESRPFPAYEIA